MIKTLRIAALTLVAGSLLPALPAAAQPLGSFRWQLQPYCNTITVTVVQQGGQYQLDGTDDQCGAAVKGSVVGLAFQNPDGSIGFGLSIVTAPGGTPVHVDATIAIATLSGTWRDSAGNNGTFIFTPGASTGGGPRPVPSGGVAPASITSVQIAPGAIGAAQVNTDQIQQRVSGACGAGFAMTAVNANGTVVCASVSGLQRVYSGYRLPAAAAVEVTLDSTLMRSYFIPEPLITQSVIDTAQVQVWLRFTSEEIPLPYTSMAGGTANTIWARPEVGGIRVYRMTHGCTTSGCLINLPSSLRYRFAFVTGGTPLP